MALHWEHWKKKLRVTIFTLGVLLRWFNFYLVLFICNIIILTRIDDKKLVHLFPESTYSPILFLIVSSDSHSSREKKLCKKWNRNNEMNLSNKNNNNDDEHHDYGQINDNNYNNNHHNQ